MINDTGAKAGRMKITGAVPPTFCFTVRTQPSILVVLSPESLTITQHLLLANLARGDQLSHAVLAERVGMDRTTRTRDLRPLTRAG